MCGNFASMFGEGGVSNFYLTPHRVYQPNYGRWMTPDPGGIKVVNLADPRTWNLYAYVTDNPTTLNDPSGLGAHCTGQSTEHNNVLTCEQAQAAAQLTATLKNSTQERAQRQTDIYELNGVVTVETSNTRTITDGNGNKITQVTTTQAFFSAKKGQEGEFLGARQTTFVGRVFNRWSRNISLSQATAILGSGAIQAGTEATAPGFFTTMNRDAAAHPYEYGMHAAGLALPFLGVPIEVEGIITAVEAVEMAHKLDEGSQ